MVRNMVALMVRWGCTLLQNTLDTGRTMIYSKGHLL